MASNDGFSSSEVMYPVATTPDPRQPLMPATAYAAPMPGMAPPMAPRGPELLTGNFNQTWLLNCLRRRWLMALLLGALFAGLTAGVLLWLFPLSASITAMVEVKQEAEDLMEKKRPFSPHELEVFQETQLGLIKSQFVLQSALNRSDIAQLEAVRKEEPDPLTWLKDNLHVSFYGENMQIRYDGEEDTEEMKKIITAVIGSYKEDVLGEDRMRSEELRDNMDKLHKELASELKEKMDKYHSLNAEIGGITNPVANSQITMLLNDIRQIQSQILKQKEKLVDITVNMELVRRQATSTTAMEEAVTAALDEDDMLEQYKAEEFALRQQLRMLAGNSKHGSAQERRLQSSLQTLQQEAYSYRMQAEQEIRQELKTKPNPTLDLAMTEYVLVRKNIEQELATLNAEYEEKLSELEQKGETDGELTMLESEIQQLQEIESDMELRLRSWKIQDRAAEELFRILQPPIAIDQINQIQRYALAGLGALAAFCGTGYCVALMEFRRRRLNGASDMDEGLGLRVLGVLPSVASRKAMAPGSLIAAQVAESIDNVRATLMHDSTTRKQQVVLVTSPATMEGTTTVASHLALSLTRAGRRTLLVDGDIREPALHKLFGMPLDDGLCELLRSDIDVADAVRPTNTEGLWLLTAGHCDMDAIHALATDQPQPIMEKLREEFDFIIIDGAPVLGLSDSISIGQHIDGAILTVLRDHSEVRKVYQAIELLKSMGIRLLGSVVNGMPLKADRRIAQLHKNNAKKPPKIAAKKAEPKKKPAESAPKAEEPAVAVEEPVADLGEIDLGDEVDIDFDDLGIDQD
ncbi:MAG: polysaccharide biosynthesis tyrosine autokinase [Planctomycetota bacterium]